MPEMDQNQFQAALRKHEARKAKKLAAEAAKNPPLKPEGFKVLGALPFEPVYEKPKAKEKPVEQPRPAPKALEIVVSGPVNFTLSLDWSGTLLGGQMNEKTLRGLFAQYLKPIGRVK